MITKRQKSPQIKYNLWYYMLSSVEVAMAFKNKKNIKIVS